MLEKILLNLKEINNSDHIKQHEKLTELVCLVTELVCQVLILHFIARTREND